MFGLLRKNDGFKGGLKLVGHKLHGEAGQIRLAPLPERVTLPVSQHIGAPAVPEVEVGQRVLRGQILANSESFIAAPVHASISGTVVEIAQRPVPHPSGLPALTIVIESDGQDEALPQPAWPVAEDPFALDAATVRERVRAAGLVGLGGAAFPSAVKLNPGRDSLVNTLILNGAECEPYISCDAALMRERAEEVVSGAELIRRSLGAQECLIGLEDNATDSATALRSALKASGYQQISIRVVPTRYPQGGEKQLIQTLTGREVPSEGLPLDIGIVVHNVGTVAAIWRALRYAEPLTSRVVTVTGPGLARPQNLEVRLGTPVSQLIEHCGGYVSDHTRLIMGGPMMGFALSSDQVPVVKATNCVLVEVNEPEPIDEAMPCIRCGECVDVCPASLLPQQLYWHARAKEFDKAQDLHLFDCIECGCCAQVCPSHIPLVQYYRYAKTEIYQAEQEKRKADIARNRHEFRLERLEKEAREKEEARRRKREALKKPATSEEAPAATPKTATGNDAIAAAIAKAKAEKARRQSEDSRAENTGSAAAAAIAKAKAAKAGAQEPTATGNTAADAIARAKAKAASQQPAGDDPVAAAIAKAKAAKAQSQDAPAPQGGNAAADAIARTKAKAAEKQAGSTESEDPVAAAIAKAKAAKAQTQGAQNDASNPAAAAIAKARAKAAQAASESPANDAAPSTAAADAIARAKAKAAEKSAQSPAADNTADDPVAAAIAKAKAAKAARENPS